MAVTDFEQGRFSAAEPLYRRAIGIQQKALAPNHPDLADSLTSYAALLRKTGRKKEASKMETLARNMLNANGGDAAARLSVDVRDLQRPDSFLPAR
jgi:hypothetical protein